MMAPLESFLKDATTPFGPKYCDFFYYLTMINFILLLYILLSALYVFLFDKKKDGIFQIVLVSLPTFMAYITNRLLYSMCVGSTQM